MVSFEPLNDPPGVLARTTGLYERRYLRDLLTHLELSYTEDRSLFRSVFLISLPQGRDTGRIPEWLAFRKDTP